MVKFRRILLIPHLLFASRFDTRSHSAQQVGARLVRRGSRDYEPTMRVLDPQSALLTNAEVYQFLKTKKPGVPEAKSGAYPSTNLHGQQTILKDVSSVLENVSAMETVYLTSSKVQFIYGRSYVPCENPTRRQLPEL